MFRLALIGLAELALGSEIPVSIWKERKLADLDSLVPEQTVQLNLSWCQGAENKEFIVTDVWVDEESRKFATELQRRRHVRYQQQRWVPGWIDHVEHFDYGGAIITITLFGGMDPSLYEDMIKDAQAKNARTQLARGEAAA